MPETRPLELRTRDSGKWRQSVFIADVLSISPPNGVAGEERGLLLL